MSRIESIWLCRHGIGGGGRQEMKQVRMHVCLEQNLTRQIYFGIEDKTDLNVISVNGRVVHDGDWRPGKFRNKSCLIEIYAPVDDEWLSKVAETSSLDKHEICGALRTTEQLLGDPAIELRICVSSEFLAQIYEAVKANQAVGKAALKLILGGETVPDSDVVFTSLRGVGDLDITEENDYAILGFDIYAIWEADEEEEEEEENHGSDEHVLREEDKEEIVNRITEELKQTLSDAVFDTQDDRDRLTAATQELNRRVNEGLEEKERIAILKKRDGEMIWAEFGKQRLLIIAVLIAAIVAIVV